MKRLFVLILLVFFVPSSVFALDIYILQYGYEESKPCEGAQHGSMFNTIYCFRPPTFEVFGSMDAAKDRLRVSDPVKAFKLTCLMVYAHTCFVNEMMIVTAKDLKEKAQEPMLWDNIVDQRTFIKVNP